MSQANCSNKWQRNCGATLIEVIVAVGIIGIMVYGMTQFIGASLKSRRRSKALSVFQFIAMDVENKLKSPSSMYFSLFDQDNVSFISCLLGAGNGCTTNLTAKYDINRDNKNYFALLYRVGTASGDASLSSAFANKPIYYDTNGQKCKMEDKSLICAFKLETFYFVTCDTSNLEIKTCLDGPEDVHVAYSLSQLDGKLKSFGAKFKSLPRTIRFITHSMTDIISSQSHSSCNPGSVITGFQKKGGRPLCKCRPPYISREKEPLGNRKGPFCRMTKKAELTCPDDKIFRGLKGDGTANCLTVDQAFECVSYVNKGMNVDSCDPGWWVQEDRRSDCNFYCTIPKQSSSICENNESAEDRTNYQGRRIGRWVNGNVLQRRVNKVYPIGLACSSRILKCCRPKGG